MKNPEDIRVTGTPTLIYVKDGQVIYRAEGVDGCKALLNNVKPMH
jgi:hypothetical protein